MWDVQITDDCVLVFGVSNEENFADHKLCIVEKEGIEKRCPVDGGRKGKHGFNEIHTHTHTHTH